MTATRKKPTRAGLSLIWPFLFVSCWPGYGRQRSRYGIALYDV
nr:MAG TPA_asm: hypothetical protein [Caudoviricetes sp.]